MDCSRQAPLSMQFSRQEYWSGLPFPSPGDLPNPGIKTMSPALQADSLPSEPPGKPITYIHSRVCVYIYIYIYIYMSIPVSQFIPPLGPQRFLYSGFQALEVTPLFPTSPLLPDPMSLTHHQEKETSYRDEKGLGRETPHPTTGFPAEKSSLQRLPTPSSGH